MRKLRVAVLMGGVSSERTVSLSTGKMILSVLDPRKYEALAVDAAELCGVDPKTLPGSVDGPAELPCESADRRLSAKTESLRGKPSKGAALDPSTLFRNRPDVVVIALHGKYGEDGTVQGLLDMLGIPYTGSGVLGSALAMDKIVAKQVLRAHGIRVPLSVDILSASELETRDLVVETEAYIGYPVIVKPNRQGSTIGTTKVMCADSLIPAVREALRHDDQALIEEFLTGTEITASLLGNDIPTALPLIEIVPSGGFYDYQAKYTPGATEEIVPARIPEDVAEKANHIAAVAHRALRCRGMSRVDMIVHDGEPYVLEVNTIPGMTPTSLLPRAAEAAGINFPKLLDRLIELALEGRKIGA